MTILCVMQISAIGVGREMKRITRTNNWDTRKVGGTYGGPGRRPKQIGWTLQWDLSWAWTAYFCVFVFWPSRIHKILRLFGRVYELPAH